MPTPTDTPTQIVSLYHTGQTTQVRAPQAMHAHTEYEVILLSSGQAQFTTADGRAWPLLPGQLLLLPPGAQHSITEYQASELYGAHIGTQLVADALQQRHAPVVTHGGLSFFSAALSPAATPHPLPILADALQKNTLLYKPHVVHDVLIYQAMLELMHQCLVELDRNDILTPAYLTHAAPLFGVLLLRAVHAVHISRTVDAAHTHVAKGSTQHRVLDVKAWLDRHYLQREISMPALAEQAHLTLHYFSQLFHELTGYAPHAYLVRRRLQYAAVMLLTTENSVENIAAQSGYDYVTNFIRAFKAQFGLPPRSYRQRHSRMATLAG